MLTVVDHHPNYGGEKKQTFESTNHCLMLCHYFTLRHFFLYHPCWHQPMIPLIHGGMHPPFTYLNNPKTYRPFRLRTLKGNSFEAKNESVPFLVPKDFTLGCRYIGWSGWFIASVLAGVSIENHWKPPNVCPTAKTLSSEAGARPHLKHVHPPNMQRRKTLWISMDTPQKESVHLYL